MILLNRENRSGSDSCIVHTDSSALKEKLDCNLNVRVLFTIRGEIPPLFIYCRLYKFHVNGVSRIFKETAIPLTSIRALT